MFLLGTFNLASFSIKVVLTSLICRRHSDAPQLLHHNIAVRAYTKHMLYQLTLPHVPYILFRRVSLIFLLSCFITSHFCPSSSCSSSSLYSRLYNGAVLTSPSRTHPAPHPLGVDLLHSPPLRGRGCLPSAATGIRPTCLCAWHLPC